MFNRSAWRRSCSASATSATPGSKSTPFAEGPGFWVRDLGDVEPHLLPGPADAPDNLRTARSLGISWSSDATKLSYCVKDHLKIHCLDGQTAGAG